MSTQDKVLDHSYDGIQEYDNRLPNWWLYTLYGAIVFSFGYWIYVHTLDVGDVPTEAYEKSMIAAAEAQLERMAGQELTDELLALMATVPERVGSGKKVFGQFCVACHLESGAGSVGPNLTDAYWIHGNRPLEIHNTVTSGVLDKGMAAWGNQLGPQRVNDVVAFVLTLKDTNVEGKEPQGVIPIEAPPEPAADGVGEPGGSADPGDGADPSDGATNVSGAEIDAGGGDGRLAMATPRTTDRRLPDLDTVYSINADGSRNFLHPADVRGTWQWIKRSVWAALIVLFFGLPLIHVGGSPILHIDIPGRAAHVFGRSFTNQDFYLLFFLFTAIGFTFFVVTSLWGRVWCGTACPHTVWLEGVFRPIERWIEGSRDRRIRRNMGPMTPDKFWRKAAKHTLYVVISFVIAHAFLAYFLPIKEMIQAMQSNPREHWAAFVWGIAWTGAIYFDNAWFREQLCLVICPYGRLQSALVDADTLVIGYDETRGEPRSKKSQSGGDCIDCGRCIAVCPTGIDIRNGLQLECVACANCIDACNDIMERVDRPRGLIRYDSRRGFEAGVRRSLFRPRVALYAVMGLVGLGVATVSLLQRAPFEAHLLRARGLPYQLTGGDIRNVTTLRVQNKTSAPQTYFITAASVHESAQIIVAMNRIRLEPLTDQTVPIVVSVDRATYDGAFDFTVTVRDSAAAREKTVEQTFLGP